MGSETLPHQGEAGVEAALRGLEKHVPYQFSLMICSHSANVKGLAARVLFTESSSKARGGNRSRNLDMSIGDLPCSHPCCYYCISLKFADVASPFSVLISSILVDFSKQVASTVALKQSFFNSLDSKAADDDLYDAERMMNTYEDVAELDKHWTWSSYRKLRGEAGVEAGFRGLEKRIPYQFPLMISSHSASVKGLAARVLFTESSSKSLEES
ncbi:hypothetical protein RHSIM_Rhsim06G0016700 [Rhododendron simsii]|uniref:Uncharacterized protein n=1 Tax=Rhododendron simsii TaxID=118357 RepID=A0A834GS02_RHOSS|nr:hypothetical protein RHSIM_Rhsim06G0016700 [Rhododendron simsii]